MITAIQGAGAGFARFGDIFYWIACETEPVETCEEVGGNPGGSLKVWDVNAATPTRSFQVICRLNLADKWKVIHIEDHYDVGQAPPSE